MALEHFEKSLAEDKRKKDKGRSHHGHDQSRRHHRHHRHHRDDEEDGHRHKRRRHSRDDDDREHSHHSRKNYRRRHDSDESEDEDGVQSIDPATMSPSQGIAHSTSDGHVQRDSWMEEPSGLDIDYIQKGIRMPSQSTTTRPTKVDFELKIHDNELNKHHLQDMADGKDVPEDIAEKPAQHGVAYRFGDAGAQWRMTKLKGVYRRAEETGRLLDEVAEEQFGDLRGFDDAREEQIELERRAIYGEGYVGRENPSGELFEERKLDMGIRINHTNKNGNNDEPDTQPRVLDIQEPARNTVPLDPTALNRLKAQMMKAKLRGSSGASSLEAEYNHAIAGFANRKQPDVVVLGAMDNRMLAGGRDGEVTSINNTRGRERGLVEENEDMSIEDMVKQERRTRHHAGGDGQRFAERIAGDAKFDVCISSHSKELSAYLRIE
jgi:hypothetical protein